MQQMESFAFELKEFFHCRLLNFSGHGGKEFEEEFNIYQFADEIISACNGHKTKPYAFGYSMGGYAALLAQLKAEKLFKGIITLGTKFDWNPQTALAEKALLNTELIETKFPSFANTLMERHKPLNWKTVLDKTALLIKHLGDNSPLNHETMKNIKSPVLITRCEFDNMVTREESTAASNVIPYSNYTEIVSCQHAFEKVNKSMLKEIILAFVNSNRKFNN